MEEVAGVLELKLFQPRGNSAAVPGRPHLFILRHTCSLPLLSSPHVCRVKCISFLYSSPSIAVLSAFSPVPSLSCPSAELEWVYGGTYFLTEALVAVVSPLPIFVCVICI